MSRFAASVGGGFKHAPCDDGEDAPAIADSQHLAVDEDFKCRICLDIAAERPTEAPCCGAIFCADHVGQWCKSQCEVTGADGASCPNCRSPISQRSGPGPFSGLGLGLGLGGGGGSAPGAAPLPDGWHVSKRTRRQIGALVVPCRWEGCGRDNLVFDERAKHELGCEHAVLACVNCDAVVPWSDRPAHLATCRPPDPDVLADRAAEAAASGDAARAAQLYQNALRIDPAHPASLVGLQKNTNLALAAEFAGKLAELVGTSATDAGVLAFAGFAASPSTRRGIVAHGAAPQLTAQLGSSMIAVTTQIRKALSAEHNPPIQLAIDAGVVPALVQMLNCSADDLLLTEAAWALTNVASGASAHTAVVVEAGAVPVLIHQLTTATSPDVKEQTVWALGNIAGDGPRGRDIVLQMGVMPPLLACLTASNQKVSMLRNATWTLSNLCRGRTPRPNFAAVAPCLPTLAALLSNQDDEVVTDAAWALSYLSDGANDQIAAVLDAGVCGRLVELLGQSNTQIVLPALRTIGNIATGTDGHTQAVLDCNALTTLQQLLQHPKTAIQQEACWTISNITAGSMDQKRAVADHQGIFETISVLLNSGCMKVRKEACFAIVNPLTLSESASQEQVDLVTRIAEQGVVKALCTHLSSMVNDDGTGGHGARARYNAIGSVLNALAAILRAGKAEAHRLDRAANEFAGTVIEAGCVAHLQHLLSHPAPQTIQDKANSMLLAHFEEFDEPDVN